MPQPGVEYAAKGGTGIMDAVRMAKAVARLRAGLNAAPSEVAEKASVDQSCLSRIEKGETVAPDEVVRVLDAFALLGSEDAERVKRFMSRDWRFLEPPSYWDPERTALELAEDMLKKLRYSSARKNNPGRSVASWNDARPTCLERPSRSAS